MLWLLSLVVLLTFPGLAGAIHTQAHRESTLLAERVGYGRNTTGGAGGTLCTVTNLNDSGAGSLRNCLTTSGPQWIIFAVSGTINLASELTLLGPASNDKTVDGRGQTITLLGHGFTISQTQTHNIIIHNITIQSAPTGIDGVTILDGANNVWLDHITCGDPVDECFDIHAAGGVNNLPPLNITLSWNRLVLPVNSAAFDAHGGILCGNIDTLVETSTFITLHHNWYNQVPQRLPYPWFCRFHAFNNYMQQTITNGSSSLGAQISEHAMFLSENDIFEGQGPPDFYPRVIPISYQGIKPGPDSIRVINPWLVTGVETYQESNPGGIFNPSATYSYTLEAPNAALRSKITDANTGAGMVPNPYNSVAAGAPTVNITSPTSAATYNTGTTPLTPTLQGSATDDVGVVSVTWACPTCTPTSGTATCATCGASATSVSWSVASIGLASGANVITVTATDTDSSTGTDTLTVTRSAPDVTTGLIAHYKFNDNASPATDSTGLGHSGTLVGTPAYVAGTTNMGRALSLNGTTQYVTTLDAANLDFTTAYTLAAWINPPATLTGNNPLIVKNYQGTPGYYLYANITSSANCGSVNQIVGGHQPGQVGDACTTTTLPAGTWSHVAVTFDGTNTQIYVNGVASGLPRTPTASAAAGTGTLDIGHSSWGEFLPAIVDDVRVYNRALTATDMAVLGVLPDISTGLRAHYKFNDAAGTATDSTGLGHTGTFQPGGATYGAGAPNLGTALALNGTSQYVSVADAADLDFTTAYTLTGWFFPTSAGAPNAGIVKPGPGTPQYAYYLYPRIPSACGAGIDAVVVGYNPSNQVCYATALTSNQWTHVGVTFANGSATTLYVGGIPVATGGATAPTVATAQALLLGNSQFSEFFAGRMDEIRLYNRELTAVDMNAVASVVDASNPPTVTITTDCGAGAGNNCTVSSATLTTFAGTATDDVGVPANGITWTCPTCTPASGTATCATCGPSATSVSWSVASITLASGTNVLTVTVLDADGQASTPPDSITITYTVVSSTVPTVLRLVR